MLPIGEMRLVLKLKLTVLAACVRAEDAAHVSKRVRYQTLTKFIFSILKNFTRILTKLKLLNFARLFF